MGSGAITVNFSKELDSTDCSIRGFERLDFEVKWCNQFKFKWVFRRFAFIQANIFFLKLKRILTKLEILCVKS